MKHLYSKESDHMSHPRLGNVSLLIQNLVGYIRGLCKTSKSLWTSPLWKIQNLFPEDQETVKDTFLFTPADQS